MGIDWGIDQTWTLFLDRDGVINERIMGGYVLDKSQFRFKEGAIESLGKLTNKFCHVFVVTNQQGVGLENMSEIELNEIHLHMTEQIHSNGGKISKVFSATELKNEQSQMRKPKSKMALMAQKEFPEVNFEKSIMVGDTDSDILFGKKLGMKTVLILTEEKTSEKPDIIVNSLHELNNLI